MSVKDSVDGIDVWLDKKLTKLPDSKKGKRKPGEKGQDVRSRLRRAGTTIKSLDDIGDRMAGRMAAGTKGRGGLVGFYDRLLNKPVMVIIVVLIIAGVSSIPALSIIKNMRGDLEIYLPAGHPATNGLKEVNKDWTTDTVVVYVRTRSRDINITNVEVLQEISAVEGDDNTKNRADWKVRGLDWDRADRGANDNITTTLSIASIIKTINATPSALADAIEMEFPNFEVPVDLPGNYSIPTQDVIDKIVGQIPASQLKSLVADTNGDGVWDRAAVVFMIRRGTDPTDIVGDVDTVIKHRAEAAGHHVPTTNMVNTGPYTVIEKMQGRTIFEFMKVLPFLILFLMGVLFYFHRNWKVIPITLTPVMLALGVTMGITGAVSDLAPSVFLVSPQVALIVPVLLALGVSYGLYISNRYVEEKTGTPKEKMLVTVKSMNNAILLSAFTTFIGFASLMVGTLPPIFTMGFALAIGILLTYTFTMLVAPPMVMVLGYEKRVEFSTWGSFAPVPSANRKKIIALALVITLISCYLIPMVKFDADYLAMMPSDDPAIISLDEYSKAMNGGMIGMVIVRADPQEYDTLHVTDSVELDMNKVKYSTCLSIVDMMKTIKTPENVTIPLAGGVTVSVPGNVSYWDLIQMSPRWLPQPHNSTREVYIRLFYNSLGPEYKWMFVNPGWDRSLIYVFMPYLNVEDSKVAVDGINAVIKAKGTLSGGTMSNLIGVAPLIIAINDLIIIGSFQTLALSIFMCFIILTVVFRSWKIGALSMVPCCLVVSYEPLTLVGMNIPLSIITVMIGSIAIGTGVDFSIQISQRMSLMGMGLKQVRNTVEHMGVSFVEATSTMVMGFAAVLVAPWPGAGPLELPVTFGVGIDSIRQFVIMIMLLLTFNAICALFVLPALYTIWIRSKEADLKKAAEVEKMAKKIEDEEEDLPQEYYIEADLVPVGAEDMSKGPKPDKIKAQPRTKEKVPEEEIPKIY